MVYLVTVDVTLKSTNTQYSDYASFLLAVDKDLNEFITTKGHAEDDYFYFGETNILYNGIDLYNFLNVNYKEKFFPYNTLSMFSDYRLYFTPIPATIRKGFKAIEL